MAAISSVDLVGYVMERLGCDGPADLVNALGLRPSAYGTVNRWVNGGTKPSYEATMMLLDAAGWLNVPDEGRPQSPLASAATPAGQAAREDDAAARLEAIVNRLAEQVDRLASLPERAAG